MAKQKRTKRAKRTDVRPVVINLPPDIGAWLDQRAVIEDRTMTAIVSRALRAEMAAAEAAGERQA